MLRHPIIPGCTEGQVAFTYTCSLYTYNTLGTPCVVFRNTVPPCEGHHDQIHNPTCWLEASRATAARRRHTYCEPEYFEPPDPCRIPLIWSVPASPLANIED